LFKNPNINGVTFTASIVGDIQYITMGDWEINGIKRSFAVSSIDPDFFDVMKIKMIDGRNFSWDNPSDNPFYTHNLNNIVVNETFVREYELNSPVGYSINNPDGSKFEIIGVVSDFHDHSLKEKILPTVFLWWGGNNYLNIRITPIDIPGTIDYINKVCKSAEEQDPYWTGGYSFLDKTFDRQYKKDEQTAKIIAIFALVAILIACLGLYGLSSFIAAQRTKEIGIRKAMGASIRSIFMMLSLEFTKVILFSIIIACPIAWFAVHKWLQSFAYHTGISWWIFALAIMITIVIAFGTVTWQALRTARINPVESLRYE
jgi:putative ABC transport system permease protein